MLTGKILDLSASHPEMPDISSGFMIVLAKSLERDPDKRYQDAGEMLKAIVQVHKKDKKYRRLLLKQELVSVAIMLLAAVSVFMIVEGRRKMAAEHLGYYYELADTLEEGAISGMEEEQFNSIYEEAVDMYPNYLDAYYYKAYYLFATGDYVNTTEYIAEVLTYTTEGVPEMTANLYHLYAECFFRMEDYQNAKTYYQTALKYSDSNPSIYRDYAISLVYLDQVAEAEKVLEQAISKDMAQAEVYMVQGEIERMSGNYEKALECLNGVLQETEDEYLIQRAYIVGSKTYADMGTAEALGQDVEWLNEGIKELSMSNRLLLYERLAQDYISLGEQTQDNANYEVAVSVFEEIKTMNWDTYLTYSNAIILCQRIGDLAKAEEWAQEMLAQYPENYVTYMRLAYLEIEKQNKKENADREYQTFERYYKQAKEYYEQQTSGNVTNAEIQLLDNTYQQVVDGGWLK